MKTKKMLKRLNKVEGLLSDVIDGLLTSQDSLGRLLGAAKANVAEVVSQLENGEGSREALQDGILTGPQQAFRPF